MAGGIRLSMLAAGSIILTAILAFAASGTNEDQEPPNRITIQTDQGEHTINKNIYGHFSEHLGRCVYEGYWVGEDSPIPNVRGIRKDVVEALRKIRIPVLRWPGGCFADEYHWKNGIGPNTDRPSMVNTHWGGVTESNHFGTHEFLDLCEQLGCEPYICGNVGSGTVREMADWVEYITFDGLSPMADLRRQNGRDEPWKLRYFGVGNENWGCGGTMRPEYYADEYRRFQTYVKNYSGNRIYKIACGAYGENTEWTEVLMREAGGQMHGLSYHYYTVPGGWGNKNSATDFDEADWFENMQLAGKIGDYIKEHAAIMDKYDPDKRVGMIVDEWGNWYEVEPGTNRGFLYQQNTLRDALTTGLTLNIFNSHCDRVRMANLAQTVNVLQALVLTDKEKMVVTPTYHVFDMYQVHQDAVLLPVEVQSKPYQHGEEEIVGLSVSASRLEDGTIHVTLCNLDPNQAVSVEIDLEGARPGSVSGRVLSAEAMNAHNTFEDPDAILPVPFDDVRLQGGGITTVLPSKSVVVLTIK